MSNADPFPSSKPFIYFDPEMELYEPFMKNPDGATLLNAGEGTRMESALKGLVQSWRGAHYARGMPWLMTRAGIDAASGALQREMPEFAGSMLLDGLQRRMHQTHLRVRDRRELVRVIGSVKDEIETKLKEERGKPPTESDYKQAWDSYLELTPFKIGLEASEVSAYLTLYFAYENLVASSVEIRSGEWPTSAWRIGAGFREHYGDDAWARLWTERAVAAARHTRDAIAHRGGRSNDETADLSDIVRVDQGFILIGARDTNALYLTLLDRVLRLLEVFRNLEVEDP